MSHVRVCESHAYPVFNQSSGGYSFASHTVADAIIQLLAGIFYCLPLRKNNAVKLISFKQNNLEVFIAAT